MTALTLRRDQALQVAGTRAGADFLFEALVCTQSKTAQARGGGFWKSHREWQECHIGRTALNNATRKLTKAGILVTWKEIDRKRIVGGIRTWYKVNVDRLKEVLGLPFSQTLAKLADRVKPSSKKPFDQKPGPKPAAAHFTAQTFGHCNPFTLSFIDWLTHQKNRHASGQRLFTFFSRYGFGSGYVRKAFSTFLGQWGGVVEEHLLSRHGPRAFDLVAAAQTPTGKFRVSHLLREAQP